MHSSMTSSSTTSTPKVTSTKTDLPVHVPLVKVAVQVPFLVLVLEGPRYVY